MRNLNGGPKIKSRYRYLLIAVDATAIVVSTVSALVLRTMLPLPYTPGDLDRLLLPVVPGLGLGWLATLGISGAYRRRHWGAGITEYRQVLNTSLYFLGAVGLLAFTFEYPLSRGFLAIQFLLGVPLLMLGRLCTRRLLHLRRKQGKGMVPTIVAGNGDAAADLVAILNRETWLGYQPIGLAVNEKQPNGTDLPVLSDANDILKAISISGARAVIFTAGSFRTGKDFNQTARDLENIHAEMIVVPAVTDVAAQRIFVRPVAGIPLMHVDKPQAERALRWTKRIFDLVVATFSLIVAIPLFAVTALAIKLEDGGPIFFKQTRVGKSKDPFELYKFRSMVVDAEKIREKTLQNANEADGNLFKMKQDPRITKVGRFIRRYSIDELPQLINVFKGEMSLVGPRPALPEEVAKYKSHVERRLDVRPGMTGLWQVSGRSDLSWDDAVRLDLYYVDNWSLLQDLVILLRTVQAVVTPRGAY